MIIDGVTMVTSSECAVSTVSESEAKEVCMSVYMRYLSSSPFFSPPQFMLTQQQEEGEGGKEEEEGDEADDLVRNVVSCLQLRLEGFLACARECTFCDNYDKKAVLAESEPTQFSKLWGPLCCLLHKHSTGHVHLAHLCCVRLMKTRFYTLTALEEDVLVVNIPL